VGAIWDLVREAHDDHVEMALPETLGWEEIESAIGPEGMRHLPESVHRVDDRRVLRWDTSIPMLLAARGRPAGEKLMAAGKVYRDDPVDRSHLKVFHQAEILHVGIDVGEWDLMPRVTRWVEKLLDGARIRLEQVEYLVMCERAWELSVDWNGEWIDVLAWGPLRADVVRALGHDPDRVAAVGLGMGLERIACLRYGIDDVRKVESTRL
jgi:phenylalanyl-tRNA synthetase alpha chain